ncbi:hypothetical protein H310_06021 [Aphanomyces invadans]|uniref:Uncharacterized protein n=1 Tax=Aphanomyces invadans TaxID=157072 RepID=A0A024U8J6_9STRA|nr:hypothetical protein H310_06021 [Aphanomyces invadans]ETW02535.1 hypothetical protein H310_06021 [Aphanomyces invadans]|eukprot:XP_008869140.1 hypothetical protein H310_06021 [Aphanomyces invadans]
MHRKHGLAVGVHRLHKLPVRSLYILRDVELSIGALNISRHKLQCAVWATDILSLMHHHGLHIRWNTKWLRRWPARGPSSFGAAIPTEAAAQNVSTTIVHGDFHL